MDCRRAPASRCEGCSDAPRTNNTRTNNKRSEEHPIKQSILGAACAGLLVVASGAAQAAAISGQGTWVTTLQGRDLDGNLTTAEAYYDTVLNITWLNGAVYTNGSWGGANTWAAGLNPYSSGITGWRLPKVNPIDGTTADDLNSSNIGTEDRGYNVSAPGTLYAGSSASELAHLFYNTLGNKSSCNPLTSTVFSCVYQGGYGLNNTGPFSNLSRNFAYWTATPYAPSYPVNVWVFAMESGLQDFYQVFSTLHAIAVHNGDVGAVLSTSAVPVPAAAWLFGSGLLGLLGVSRTRRG